MGIRSTTNVINIFQTVLSSQFVDKLFIVTNPATRTYNLGVFSSVSSEVVLLNGLFQIAGVENSYLLVGTDIVFNADTLLTVGDSIRVLFDGQV